MRASLAKFIYFTPIVATVIIYFSVIRTLPQPLVVAPEHELILKETTPISINLSEARDLIGHAAMYTLLTLAIYVDLFRNKTDRRKSIIISLITPILFGGIMELVQQYFFPPRSAELTDFIADSLGTIVGIAIIILFNRHMQNKGKASV